MSTRRTSTGDAPLVAWEHALRTVRHHARIRRIAAGLAVGGVFLGATIVCPPAPRLVWNTSPSVPIGLYRVNPGAPARVGDMVLAQVPASWRALAAGRRYIPANVPLVKRVVAAAGATVVRAVLPFWSMASRSLRVWRAIRTAGTFPGGADAFA